MIEKKPTAANSTMEAARAFQDWLLYGDRPGVEVPKAVQARMLVRAQYKRALHRNPGLAWAVKSF